MWQIDHRRLNSLESRAEPGVISPPPALPYPSARGADDSVLRPLAAAEQHVHRTRFVDLAQRRLHVLERCRVCVTVAIGQPIGEDVLNAARGVGIAHIGIAAISADSSCCT